MDGRECVHRPFKGENPRGSTRTVLRHLRRVPPPLLRIGRDYRLAVLILEVDPLDAVADTCQYLVGDGVEDIGQHSYR